VICIPDPLPSEVSALPLAYWFELADVLELTG
jgi:hypothetical protein